MEGKDESNPNDVQRMTLVIEHNISVGERSTSVDSKCGWRIFTKHKTANAKSEDTPKGNIESIDKTP